MAKKIDIGGELHSVATDHKVADASEIKDISKENKSQAAFNNDIARHEVEIHGTGGIDSRLTDVEQIEQIVLDGGEVQIAQGSDFTNPDATKRAKIPTVGAILDGLNDGIYDVSKRNPTGGPNNDGKFTLEYILSNADTLIPTSRRHGGMIISFVQTSDNKYVQYRLMSATWSTTISDWQGVDDEPTAGSDNLVNSGGVANKLAELEETNGFKDSKEYIAATTDNEGKVLCATKPDGSVYHYTKHTFEGGIDSEEIRQIGNKVNKEPGKSLADEHFLQTVYIEDNKEFAEAVIDTNGRIIESKDKYLNVTHHTRHIFKAVASVGDADITQIDNKEYISALTDKEGRLIKGVKPDGTLYLANIDSPTIDELNKKIEDIDIPDELYPTKEWLPLVKNYKRTGIVSASRPQPQTDRTTLSLLWMSDIHNSKDNTERFLYFGEKYKDYIDDMLLTGDLVGDMWTNDISGITGLIGFDKVLFCIGNHDLTSYNGEVPYIEGNVPKPEAFARYFKQWSGVVYPDNASTEGKLYWYKDYDAAKIRLISLCYSGFSSDTVQQTWFADVLEGARVNGYAVLAATHVPRGKKIAFSNCTFEGLDNAKVMAYDSNTVENDIVNTFISNGGEFICWLFGHTHDDHCGYMKDYPHQAYIVIGGALANDTIWQDTYRPIGTKAQDLFNILSIEPTDKLIRVARVGAEFDRQGRHRGTMIISYGGENPELKYNY